MMSRLRVNLFPLHTSYLEEKKKVCDVFMGMPNFRTKRESKIKGVSISNKYSWQWWIRKKVGKPNETGVYEISYTESFEVRFCLGRMIVVLNTRTSETNDLTALSKRVAPHPDIYCSVGVMNPDVEKAKRMRLAFELFIEEKPKVYDIQAFTDVLIVFDKKRLRQSKEPNAKRRRIK